MPPTTGVMKIERGVVYNPTIHHGYLLEKNHHPGRRQDHESVLSVLAASDPLLDFR
jgi:hypothetical protein